MSLIEKFNSRWQYTPGCWLWTNGKNAYGYGNISINGKMVLAHRLSYQLNVGAIPVGLHILHRCDVRACVNPDHLFAGTHAENMADMNIKGRATDVRANGEANGAAKLTTAQVIEIRALDIPGPQIAKRYGITKQNVWIIKARKAWRHI